MTAVSAFILAGGASTRMGSDKALLTFAGRKLIERAIEIARRVSSDVRIVGPRERYNAFGDVIEDVFPGHGPLGGIHAALRSSSTDLNLVLAVDTPFLNPEFLNALIDAAVASGRVVTLPRVNGIPQTLCAVYRRDFAQLAEQALKQGRNKIDALFTPENVQFLSEDELKTLAVDPAMFENLNTPEEFERAAQRTSKQ